MSNLFSAKLNSIIDKKKKTYTSVVLRIHIYVGTKQIYLFHLL